VFVRAAADSLFVGRSIAVTAIATDDDSARVAWPRFDWRSSDTTVVVVDSVGVAYAAGPGSAFVSAGFDGHADSVRIRVVFQQADDGAFLVAAAEGYARHCALAEGGVAYCRETLAGDSAGTYVPLSGAASVTLTSLHTSASHTCGLSAPGVLHCWGSNAAGEFLTGTRSPGSATDAPAVGGGSRRFSAVGVGTTSGNGSTCGVDRTDGLVYCAGQNQYLQLGRAPAVTTDTVVAPMTTQIAATSLSLAAGSYACAIGMAQAVYCWGSSSGVSGASGNADGEVPRIVSGNVPFVFVSTTTNHACGISVNGFAYCWGSNSAGQLGRGTISPGATSFAGSVQSVETFVSISTAPGYTCGVTDFGSLLCWGNFPPGAYASYLGARRAAPVTIAREKGFVAVTAGIGSVCAITENGAAMCF
jgi:hypothetical protein